MRVFLVVERVSALGVAVGRAAEMAGYVVITVDRLDTTDATAAVIRWQPDVILCGVSDACDETLCFLTWLERHWYGASPQLILACGGIVDQLMLAQLSRFPNAICINRSASCPPAVARMLEDRNLRRSRFLRHTSGSK